MKNIHKNRHGITGNGEGGKRKESWTDVSVSAALGCCVSACVSWVCGCCSVRAHRLQALLSVCAVQVVSWMSDSFSEVSMHNSNAD